MSYSSQVLIPGSQLSDTKPEVSQTADWLLLDLNSYFASCEQEVDPSIRGKPVGVVPMLADTTSCIAMSYEAKAKGVKMGMPLSEVKKLCPDIVFREARHDLYVRFHHKIVEAIETCLPIGSVLSIDEVACRLTGSQRPLETAAKIAIEMKRKIQSEVGVCLRSSVGLGPNVMLAKMASDYQKPDGLTAFLKENLPYALHPLPLRAIPGVGVQMEKRILQAGIKDMKELCDASTSELRRIWGGIQGERFHQWLRGEEPVTPATQTRSIGHEHVLAPSERSIEAARKVVLRLLDRACVRLRKNGFYASRLSLRVKPWNRSGDDQEYFEDDARLSGTQDTLEFFKEFQVMWAKIPRDFMPLKVGVTLSDFSREKEHQLSLFQDPARERLSHAMDEINSRYGKKAVTYADLYKASSEDKAKIAFQRVPGLDEV